MGVSYEKNMRDKAKNQGKGLMSMEVIFPGSKPGKLGGRFSMQGPATKEEVGELQKFMFSMIERRAKK